MPTSDTPKRIQRKRTKGWKMPEGAVYVGRPGPHGNPFRVGGWFMMGDPDPRYSRTPLSMAWCETSKAGEKGFILIDTPRRAVDWYRDYRRKYPLPGAVIAELRGKDLACWCPLDQPCHADVLLEIANAH